MRFYMKEKQVAPEDLSPTQREELERQIDGIDKLLVPIACIKYNDKFYVLDGHARCTRAKHLGLKSIQAAVLLSQANVDSEQGSNRKRQKTRQSRLPNVLQHIIKGQGSAPIFACMPCVQQGAFTFSSR
jgi:hypothetical protein